jgi:hypothetical protein
MPAVTVNLDVTVDASGNVSVFGQAPVTMTNVIVPAVTLSAADLWKSTTSSLIQFQGPSSAPETIVGRLDSVFAANAGFKTALKTHLAAIVAGAFDCSGATPYASYSAVDGYFSRLSFGHVALGAYAHDLFGHVAATAAIDNDTAFMAAMNGTGATDANIAGLLGDAIFALSEAKCTAIAKQVVGQDAARAMSEDNDQYSPDLWQDLKFSAGDIVYVSINLQAPRVSLTNAAQQTTPTSSTARTYALKITLAA